LLFRASIVAMVFGTALGGNPWTFPFVWLATYKVGHGMLHPAMDLPRMRSEIPDHFDLSLLMQKPFEYFLPMLAGSVPLGILLWLVAFYISRYFIVRHRAARLMRLEQKRGNTPGENS
jgi:uncharacterized protein (DUF2062 family)